MFQPLRRNFVSFKFGCMFGNESLRSDLSSRASGKRIWVFILSLLLFLPIKMYVVISYHDYLYQGLSTEGS